MQKGVLKVIDFRIWANHGWYEEERILGGEYRIDVTIELNVDSTITEISQTANYELVIIEIRRIMEGTFKLIETTTSALYEAIESRFTNIASLKVELTKMNVPIKDLSATSFSLSSN